MTGRVVGRQAKMDVTFHLPGVPNLSIEFVVDTGFAGGLALPESAVRAMGLPFFEQMVTNLADNSVRLVNAHHANVEWQGQETTVVVLAMGNRALLGTDLLDGNDLMVRFQEGGPVEVRQV